MKVFKKTLTMAAAVIITFSAGSRSLIGNVNTVSAENDSYVTSAIHGDISGNGKIDLYDAIEIAKYMAGKRQFTAEEMKIADLNNDGKVNLYDAIEVGKYMVNERSNKKNISADLTAGMKSQPVTGAEADEEFVMGQTEFALNLFKSTVSNEKNSLISPYSVMQALAMTANGADNNTKAQMEKVLGGMPIEKLNEYLYTQRIGQPNDEKCKLSTANSIWYKNDPKLLTVLPEFLQRNADYYNASAYSSPFNNTTVNDINNWVNQKTDEMIPHLLDSIPEYARMYLINAVAFDAKWEEEYSGGDVHDERQFKAFDGSSQEVRMMSSTEKEYLEDENATGFYKYYEGRRYAFAALLPKEGMTVGEYINTLTPESLYNTLSNSQEKIVHAALPKFGYDYDVTLNDVLPDMGMPDAFDDKKADFTKMIKSKENIYIDSVLHKTHIDVTEEGTRAAAVTAVAVAGDAPPNDETRYVTLDRPFVYCIVDTQTSLPIFIGAVNSVNENSDKKNISADLTAGMKSQPVTGAEADEEFVMGQTEFALNLFKNTVSDNENTLVSPYSVMQALAMTANGADNNTKAQMEKVLGGMPIEMLNEYLYTQRIGQPNDEKCKLSTANSIWYRNDPRLCVLPEFLQRNADYYNASAYSSPFDDTTVDDINNWVNQKTDKMIPKLLDNIPAATMMYLINAVAFDAKWENKYSDVYDGTFKTFDVKHQQVRMMSEIESNYLEDENAMGFYKYYKGRRYAFAALLPKEGMSVSEYINTLTPESLYNTLSTPQKKSVQATIPKFSYDYEIKLNDTLSDMGMPDAFGSDADFSKMSEHIGMYIDIVLHKTHIDVAEDGTRAAAVTMVGMTESARFPDEVVTLDRPFVYCIVDTQTSLPVFIGAVNSVNG